MTKSFGSLPFIRSTLTALLCLPGCTASLAPPSGDGILCVSDSDCPEQWTCTLDGRCAASTLNDNVGPSLLSATASALEVTLSFDEPLAESTARVGANYSFAPALTVGEPRLDVDRQQVTFAVADQRPGDTYTVTVTHLTDPFGNPLVVSTATFVGFGTAPQRDPPTLIAPVPHSTVRTDAAAPGVTLLWAAVSGADYYRVQIASDAQFEDVFESADEVRETFYVPQLLAGRDSTTYWRVQANVTEPFTAWSSASFEPVGDVVYVYCADTDASCAAPASVGTAITNPESGNRSTPFRSIQRAIDYAATTLPSVGSREIRIARRGGGEAYHESVTLAPGISLRGGYDDTFDPLQRSTAEAFRTRVVFSGLGLVASGIVDADHPSLIEGMHFEGEAGSDLSIAAQITASDASLSIRDCTFAGGPATLQSVGLSLSNIISPPLVVTGCLLTSAATSESIGFSSAAVLTSTNVRVQQSRMRADNPTGSATGVLIQNALSFSVTDSDVEVTGTGVLQGAQVVYSNYGELSDLRIFVGDGALSGVHVQESSAIIVRNNQVHVVPPGIGLVVIKALPWSGDALLRVMAINNVISAGTIAWLDTADSLVMTHNTLVGYQGFLVLLLRSHPVFVNNIFAAMNAGAVIYGEVGDYPQVLRGNVFVNSAFPVSECRASSGGSCTDFHAYDPEAYAGEPITVFDNAEGYMTGVTAGSSNHVLNVYPEDLFTAVSLTGDEPDLAAALAANDFHLRGLTNPPYTPTEVAATAAAVQAGVPSDATDCWIDLSECPPACTTTCMSCTCGWNDTPAPGTAPTPGVELDLEGTLRAASVTPGAFEYEP